VASPCAKIVYGLFTMMPARLEKRLNAFNSMQALSFWRALLQCSQRVCGLIVRPGYWGASSRAQRRR
jgi:hypothetical protein